MPDELRFIKIEEDPEDEKENAEFLEKTREIMDKFDQQKKEEDERQKEAFLLVGINMLFPYIL